MTTGDPSSTRQGSLGRLGSAVANDIQYLHRRWMGIAFTVYDQGPHPVLGSQQPTGIGGRILHRVWGFVGVVVVVLVYPFMLTGFITRFYTHRMDRFARRVGLLGVVLTSVLAWSGLTGAAYLREFSPAGLLALVAASGVATASSVLTMASSRIDGRPLSVLAAYPFGVTAVFLPPVVAALYSETLASVVLTRSDTLAIWLLDSVLAFGGLNAFLRATFDLVGLSYVAMWFGLAIPVGWALGLVVVLADSVRPSGDQTGGRSSQSGASDT